MKTKLLIVGRSASGKDHITNYLCNTFGLKQLLSYTTRSRRYMMENTHRFISKTDSFNMQKEDNVIAYTKIDGYEYFGTYEQLMESDIYVIDPNGIEYLRTKYEQKLLDNGIQLITIYIQTDDELRASRAMLRCDDIKTYNDRCIAESEQFNKFEDDMNYDWIVCNDDGEEAKQDIEIIVSQYFDI